MKISTLCTVSTIVNLPLKLPVKIFFLIELESEAPMYERDNCTSIRQTIMFTPYTW